MFGKIFFNERINKKKVNNKSKFYTGKQLIIIFYLKNIKLTIFEKIYTLLLYLYFSNFIIFFKKFIKPKYLIKKKVIKLFLPNQKNFFLKVF